MADNHARARAPMVVAAEADKHRVNDLYTNAVIFPKQNYTTHETRTFTPKRKHNRNRKHKSTNQPTKQPINQPRKQTNKQPTNRGNKQTTKQTIQPHNRSTKASNHPTNNQTY